MIKKCNSLWNPIASSRKPSSLSKDETFVDGQLTRYGNIVLSPSAGVLNYGQGLFEGMKAIRRHDGCLVLFCPDQNAVCMKNGADRMCMPSPSIDQFINAMKQTSLANKHWADSSARDGVSLSKTSALGYWTYSGFGSRF
ncbi:hypothetical protein Nepgr_019837 [Nepenthes gracilis]|uniref:Uncharacterized protein n=1 Tax=Nepenthes gracilis TaxID=150966 RepID=A0AAD3SW23_NEPGR|nr:hypothetical protein Nepgr_019837 [Nepenthes gracilis]